MKRQVWILMVGMALGLAGCAVGSEAPVDEGTAQQGEALGADDGQGTPAGSGSSSTAGRPRDLLSTTDSEDPSGPTPYPWQHDDDPSGGPTPYPWDDDSDEADPSAENPQTSGTTAGSGTGAAQKSTSTSH